MDCSSRGDLAAGGGGVAGAADLVQGGDADDGGLEVGQVEQDGVERVLDFDAPGGLGGADLRDGEQAAGEGDVHADEASFEGVDLFAHVAQLGDADEIAVVGEGGAFGFEFGAHAEEGLLAGGDPELDFAEVVLGRIEQAVGGGVGGFQLAEVHFGALLDGGEVGCDAGVHGAEAAEGGVALADDGEAGEQAGGAFGFALDAGEVERLDVGCEFGDEGAGEADVIGAGAGEELVEEAGELALGAGAEGGDGVAVVDGDGGGDGGGLAAACVVEAGRVDDVAWGEALGEGRQGGGGRRCGGRRWGTICAQPSGTPLDIGRHCSTGRGKHQSGECLGRGVT